ncbi:MAG TPA: hypothetical protein VHQ20_01005 [Patescibacteria group bacterium]|jgi:hypothetical protein|nr:hypothetical protein [Patescibacteria group bacterium]
MQYESITKKSWGIAIVLFIITLIAVYFKMRGAPSTIALRYNIIVGVNEVGSKYELLKIPLTGFLVGAVNYGLVRLQKFDRELIPFFAALVTALINAFLLIAVLFLFRVS